MKQQLIELGIEEDKIEGVLGLIKPIQEELDKYKPKELSEQEKEFEERLKALEEKEKAILEKEKAEQFKASVKEKGIAEELIPFLNAEVDLDVLSGVMKELQLASSFVPNSPSTEPTGGITKEQFQKMGYSERVQLMESNPALYSKLANE